MASTGPPPARERHWVCARRLRERRQALGLTQGEVVRRLSARGVAATNRAVSAMEHGSGVDIGRLPELAAALECTVTYLLGLTDDARRWEPDPPLATASPRREPALVRPASGRGRTGGSARPSWILGPEVPERPASGRPADAPVPLP